MTDVMVASLPLFALSPLSFPPPPPPLLSSFVQNPIPPVLHVHALSSRKWTQCYFHGDARTQEVGELVAHVS